MATHEEQAEFDLAFEEFYRALDAKVDDGDISADVALGFIPSEVKARCEVLE
ncbi:MAG: hypothetical protein WCT08_02075 [Patescibacteria group bacterium]